MTAGWLLSDCAATVGGVSRLLVVLVLLLAPLGTARGQTCAADCSGDAEVMVSELITCVGIVLVGGPTAACPACDADGDGGVAIGDLIAGVNSALSGCTVADLADLQPLSARFLSDTPACINDTSEIDLALQVCVTNSGSAASGPFAVHVLGEPFGRLDGLAAGAQTCLEGPYVPFSIDVLVDPDGEVAERDETNNFAGFNIPQPTPPPFCTATPTVTPTPEVSATPSATQTPVGFCMTDQDCISAGTVCAGMHCLAATHTAEPSATPTDSPTPTPTPQPTAA